MMNDSFNAELKQYLDLVDEMKKKEAERNEMLNIENVLKGVDKVVFVFRPPPLPVYHVFISILIIT